MKRSRKALVSFISLLTLSLSSILFVCATNPQVSFTIAPGTVSVDAPSSLTFTTVANISLVSQTLTQSFNTNFTGYFYVLDLQGADTGYTTTLQLSGMFTASGNVLSGGYVQFKADGPVVSVMSGLSNPNVIIDSAATGGYQSLNGAKTWIYRSAGLNTGVVGQYGQYVDLKINIPAAQSAGSYQGTIFYTFISN